MPRLNIEKTCDKAAIAAEKDALRMVTIVREHGQDEPIVWLTSNRYFPPLREIGSADVFYSGSFWNPSDAWVVYVETFEQVMESQDIYYSCPDWDNSLYGVDLRVWQYRNEEDLTEEEDELSDEWERIESV